MMKYSFSVRFIFQPFVLYLGTAMWRPLKIPADDPISRSLQRRYAVAAQIAFDMLSTLTSSFVLELTE